MFDRIGIYQLRLAAENRCVRFCGLGNFYKEMKRAPSPSDYDKVYEIGRTELNITSEDAHDICDRVWEIFNISRPADFKGHSLSVSDIITLDDAAYYVEPFGFVRVPFAEVAEDKTGQLKWI